MLQYLRGEVIVIAKPLETSQTSVAVAEKWGSGVRVPGKFGGFAIRDAT